MLRRRIFDSVHNLAHPSGRATKHLITKRFVWPGMNKDILSWARTCASCQRNKVSRHVKNPPKHITVPERFQHVHLDIIGPLPTIDNFRYCLTMIDRFSRWPEVVPIKDINADTIATGFYATWIARFGAPSTITTDRGTQFESYVFNALVKLVGCRHIRTTAYHPASNGMTERWHRSLKAAIRCHENKNWLEVLPTVMLGLRNSYKDDIKATAAEMIYGTPLRLPGEFFIDTEPGKFTIDRFRRYMQTIRPTPTRHHSRRSYFIFNKIFETSHVFVRVDHVRQPLEQPYEGPFRVIKHISDNVF